MLERIGALPKELGKPDTLLADNGYFSRSQRGAVRCGPDRADDCDGPAVALSAVVRALRQGTSSFPRTRRRLKPSSHRLQTPEGKKLYALRKQIPEPVFGNHQIGDGLPPVPSARPRQGSRGVELGDDGLEHEATVRLGGRLKRPPSRQPPRLDVEGSPKSHSVPKDSNHEPSLTSKRMPPSHSRQFTYIDSLLVLSQKVAAD